MIGCRPLSNDELATLLSTCRSNRYGERDQTLVILGVTTGFRISELLSLKIRDVSNGGELNSHVRIPASRMKGKKRARSAILAPIAKPYLERWINHLTGINLDGGNRFLFQSRNGGALGRMQAHRIITEAFSRADITGAPGELATHCLRKTFAAKMWEAHNGNIWKVQNALGHASPASTVAYLSFEDSEQREAIYSVFGDL